MCGIAGLLATEPMDIGTRLVAMLDGCQHRGPDSTGLALYGAPWADCLLTRVHLGVPAGETAGQSLIGSVLEVFGRHGAEVLERRTHRDHLIVEFAPVEDIQGLCYAVEEGAGVEIFSLGHALEIVKGVGTALEVDAAYGLSGTMGTHAIGHVRLATESRVSASGSHPFWAYGFTDVAIVHNGQITNYHKMKRHLRARGYRFRTENDSELIAVFLADKLRAGRELEQALAESVEELDGTFSFLVSTADSLGYAKDPLAAKPMVVMEREGLVAVASEEVSLNRIFTGESLDTYEPYPGTHAVWSKSTPAATT